MTLDANQTTDFKAGIMFSVHLQLRSPHLTTKNAKTLGNEVSKIHPQLPQTEGEKLRVNVPGINRPFIAR